MEFRTRTVNIENISSNEEAVEAAFKEQFPDYQLLFDEEAQAQAAAQGDTLDLVALEKAAKGNDDLTSREEWTVSNEDIAYVRDVIQILVTSNSTSDSVVDPIRQELVFLNGCIASSLENEVRGLVLSDFEAGSSLFTFLQLKLGKEVTEGRDLASLLNPSRSYSFHNHSNIAEAENCAHVLLSLKRRVFELLTLYPTHVVLQYLSRLIDKMLELSIVTPLSVMLPGIEVLSRRMHDWEVSAAQMVSLSEHINQVNKLIIRWRQLELQSWSSFLDDEDEKAAQKNTDYFCQLYSLLLPRDSLQNVKRILETPSETLSLLSTFCSRVGVRPQDLWVVMSPSSVLRRNLGIRKDENDDEGVTALKNGEILSEEAVKYTHSLIEILDSYLRGSQLLEFSSRLQLLLLLSRFLKLQLQQYRVRDTVLELNMNVLYHISRMYSVFLPAVQSYIGEIRSPIEKQLKDQVKLGKWDDQSYFSLRETSNKIHRQLFKLVYEYRDANNLKVSVVLDKFLENELVVNEQEKKKQEEKENIILQLKTKEFEFVSSYPHLEDSLQSYEQHLIQADNSLQELASMKRCKQVTQRMRQILNGSMMTHILGDSQPGDALEELATTIIVTAEELRQEKEYTIRKQKAFSSLLTHLKEQGISHLKSSIPPLQQQYDYVMRLSIPEMRNIPSITHALSTVSSSTQKDIALFTRLWAKADQYFYKDHLLLTALRVQISQQVSDQLTAADVRRCVGYSENLMLNLLQEREVILSLGAGVTSLYNTLHHIQHISDKFHDLTCDTIEVCPALMEVAPTLETLLTSNIEILAELLFFCQRMSGEVQIPAKFIEVWEESKRVLETDLDQLIVRDDSLAYRLYAVTNPDLFISILSHLQEILMRLLAMAEEENSGVFQRDQLQVAVDHWNQTLSSIQMSLRLVHEGVVRIQSEDVESIDISVLKGVLKKRNQLISQLLLIVQGLQRQSENHKTKLDTSESFTFQQTHEALLQAWNTLSLEAIHEELKEFITAILDTRNAAFIASLSLLPQVMILVKQVTVEAIEILMRGVVLNKSMGKLEYVLLRLFREVLKKGFCLPPKQEEKEKKEEGEMQEGTGMGEGIGEQDVTDQLESKDQLDGLKQDKENEETPEQEKKEENTGMDVEDDFDGKMENVKEEENEEEEEESEEEKDREMGELSENDEQEVLDEKLWDEKEEEEPPTENEKIEQDSKQQNEKNTDEMMTKEGEQEENQEQEEGEKKEEQQVEEQQIEEEKEEINDLNEQEYEDNHFKNQEQEEEEELPDNMQIEDSGEEEEVEENEGEEVNEEMEEEMEEEVAGKEEEEEGESEGESVDMAGNAEEEEEEEDVEVDDNPEETKEEKKEEEKEKLEKEKQRVPPTEGIADAEGEDQVLDAPKEKEEGRKEEKEEENQEENLEEDPAEEEKEAEGRKGGEEKEGDEMEEEEKEEDMNPYKNPEQTQRKWQEQYQRLQMVPQKEEEEKEVQEDTSIKRQPQPLSAEVKQEQSGQEVLAPSLQDVDFKPETEETNRVELEIDEEESENENQHENEEYEKEMEPENPSQPPFPESDEEKDIEESEKKRVTEASVFASDLLEQVVKAGAGREMDQESLDGVLNKADLQVQEEERIRLPFIEEDSYMNMCVQDLLTSPSVDSVLLANASAVWKEFLAQTTDLSSRLTEQLRLLMEPTKASKLSGDFKTGKRINMRKVIPFIASNYRKDKIWLRRSRPSQREYQIMLVIDDSESMKQNNAGMVTFKTLALIGNALAQVRINGLDHS